MNLESINFKFKLLTPCFSGTALGKHGGAEMRVPPIRGHIRFWHRVLFTPDSDRQVWGSASGEKANASRVGLKLCSDGNAAFNEFPILPHKNQGSGVGKALPPGAEFEIQLQRLVGCTDDDWQKAKKAAKLWLLLGSLGLRSNRAAGSVWPVEDWTPKNKDDLKALLNSLGLNGNNSSIALIGREKNFDAEKLRAAASDTIRDGAPRQIFGSMSPRKPSPLKFKVIELDGEYCLLAFVSKTMNSGSARPGYQLIKEAEKLLKSKRDAGRWKELGDWEQLF